MTRPSFSHRPDPCDLGVFRHGPVNLPGVVCSTPPALSDTGGTMQATGLRAGPPLTDHARAHRSRLPHGIWIIPLTLAGLALWAGMIAVIWHALPATPCP